MTINTDHMIANSLKTLKGCDYTCMFVCEADRKVHLVLGINTNFIIEFDSDSLALDSVLIHMAIFQVYYPFCLHYECMMIIQYNLQ